MKNIATLFIAFFCITAQAEQLYDHVQSVKVNGIDVTKPINYGQFVKLFSGTPPVFKSSVFSECTGNYDVSMDSVNPVVRLEYFQELNSKFNLEKVFKASQPNISNNGLKAKIWLDWKPFDKQSIQVGGNNVTEAFKLSDFAKKFPLSYKKGAGDKSGTYEVLFGLGNASDDPESQEEAPPYTPSVEFLFNDGKLKELKVLQGVSC